MAELAAVLRRCLRAWKRVEWRIRILFRTHIVEQRFPFDTTVPLAPSGNAWMQRMCAALEDAGIHYLVSWGTALGIVRDGRFIPHDNDIDIDVVDADGKTVERILEAIGMTLGRRVRSRRFAFAPMRIEQLMFYSSDEDHVMVDVHFWHSADGELLLNRMDDRVIVQMPRKLLMDLGSVDFRGKTYPIPRDAEGYLSHLYGDWRTPRTYKERDWTVGCRAVVPVSGRV